MSNSFNSTGSSKKKKNRAKIKHFFEKQAEKIRHGKFTCPFCKEVFTGLSALGAHLKKHCT